MNSITITEEQFDRAWVRQLGNHKHGLTDQDALKKELGFGKKKEWRTDLLRPSGELAAWASAVREIRERIEALEEKCQSS